MACNGAVPDISVICTVRNGMNTVGDAMDSVLAQTLGSWELIAVDDGSDDGTVEILKRRAAEDSRVMPVFTEGIGRGRALNLAISSARAELICNIDADDIYHPQHLEIQMAKMVSHPEYSVIGTDTCLLLGEEKPRWRLINDAAGIDKVPVLDITESFAYHNPIAHSSAMMRRDRIMAAGAYSIERRSQLDYDLWVRLVERGEHIGVVQYPLTARRISRGQSFESRSHFRYVWSSIAIQARGTASRRAGILGWGSLALRLAWSICPRGMRLVLQKLYQDSKHRRPRTRSHAR